MKMHFERITSNFDYFYREDRVGAIEGCFDSVLQDAGFNQGARDGHAPSQWVCPHLQAVIDMATLREGALSQAHEIEQTVRATVERLPALQSWPTDEYYYRHDNFVGQEIFKAGVEFRAALLKATLEKVLHEPGFFQLPMMAGHHAPYGVLAQEFPYEEFMTLPTGNFGEVTVDWLGAMEWIHRNFAGSAGELRARKWASKWLIHRLDLAKNPFDASKGKVTLSTDAGWGPKGIMCSLTTLCAFKIVASWCSAQVIDIGQLRQAAVALSTYELEPGVVHPCGAGLQVRFMKGELRFYLSITMSEMLRMFISTFREQ